MWFNLDGAIGHPYGRVFEAVGGKVKPADEFFEIQNVLDDQTEPGKDNRNIVDTSDSQKLSREEIEEMRKQGEKGEDVVKQLIQNSTTFKDKTEYSKEKYIKKKTKKHLYQFTIFRPSTRLIAEMYFNKGPAKINHLRMDALAQMLTYGDVRAHNRQLVIDSCNGLLLAATVERMGGYGTILQLHAEQEPPRQALEGYSFSEQHINMLHNLPLHLLSSASSDLSGKEAPDAPPPKKKRMEGESESMQHDCRKISNGKAEESTNTPSLEVHLPSKEQDVLSTNSSMSDLQNAENEGLQANAAESIMAANVTSEENTMGESVNQTGVRIRNKTREKQLNEALKVLQEGNFDSLLVAARMQPAPIITKLLDFLADSRPVAVFSCYQQPLIDCYQRLRDSGRVVHLRLTDTWLRNYQVLANRTHPEINMSTNGGYLLTFIKVKAT